jgi:hypothetical protein
MGFGTKVAVLQRVTALPEGRCVFRGREVVWPFMAEKIQDATMEESPTHG